jgi:hypothetical protein
VSFVLFVVKKKPESAVALNVAIAPSVDSSINTDNFRFHAMPIHAGIATKQRPD